MSFTINAWKTLQNNHRMIRSRKSKGGNKTFSLPPTSATTSPEERALRMNEYKKKRRTRNLLSYFALAILVATIFYMYHVIHTDQMKLNDIAPAENCGDYDIATNNSIDSTNICLLNRMNSKGFKELSVRQYDAALLFFESGLLIDKKSKEANLGITYALIGICKRQGVHCELKDKYLNYINGSSHYSKSDLNHIDLFIAGMDIDYYLKSLGNKTLLAYSD